MSLSSTPHMWSPPLKRCVHCAVLTLLQTHRGQINSLSLFCRSAAEELRLRGPEGAEDGRSLTGFFLLYLSCSPPRGRFTSLRLPRMTQVSLQTSLDVLQCQNMSWMFNFCPPRGNHHFPLPAVSARGVFPDEESWKWKTFSIALSKGLMLQWVSFTQSLFKMRNLIGTAVDLNVCLRNV